MHGDPGLPKKKGHCAPFTFGVMPCPLVDALLLEPEQKRSVQQNWPMEQSSDVDAAKHWQDFPVIAVSSFVAHGVYLGAGLQDPSWKQYWSASHSFVSDAGAHLHAAPVLSLSLLVQSTTGAGLAARLHVPSVQQNESTAQSAALHLHAAPAIAASLPHALGG